MKMKRNFLIGFTLVVGVILGVLGSRMSRAQDTDNLKGGKILQRMELKGAPGLEAILVERTLTLGAESGKHTQSGSEIGYVLEGLLIFEAEGKPPLTVKAGQTFTTNAGEVHNVKNASSDPTRALVFYVAKKGAKLEDLSVPVK